MRQRLYFMGFPSLIISTVSTSIVSWSRFARKVTFPTRLDHWMANQEAHYKQLMSRCYLSTSQSSCLRTSIKWTTPSSKHLLEASKSEWSGCSQYLSSSESSSVKSLLGGMNLSKVTVKMKLISTRGISILRFCPWTIVRHYWCACKTQWAVFRSFQPCDRLFSLSLPWRSEYSLLTEKALIPLLIQLRPSAVDVKARWWGATLQEKGLVQWRRLWSRPKEALNVSHLSFPWLLVYHQLDRLHSDSSRTFSLGQRRVGSSLQWEPRQNWSTPLMRLTQWMMDTAARLQWWLIQIEQRRTTLKPVAVEWGTQRIRLVLRKERTLWKRKWLPNWPS